MTLPAHQPLRSDKRRGGNGAGRSLNSARVDRRRAVRSWAAGYGALAETHASTILSPLDAYPDAAAAIIDPPQTGKVAETGTLLDSALRHAATPSAPLRASISTRRAMPGVRSLLFGGGGRRGNCDDQSETRSPLVKRRNGGDKHVANVRPASSFVNLRKCETALTLTNYLRSSSSSSSIEPLQPMNRLRISPLASQTRLCSRCSSLLTLASASRYSLNSAAGGFVPVTNERKSSPSMLCKLCLSDVPQEQITRIAHCSCAFCTECMKSYVEFEIAEGAYDISCPDAQCSSQGVLQLEEIKRLAGKDLLEKHKKYRLNREVELDKTRMWCPRAGCETVCSLCPIGRCAPQGVSCPTCSSRFCSSCKLEWHEDQTCEEYTEQLSKEGKIEEPGIPFDSDLIKCCPMCNVPIEKDEGCAQMMCKRCKHVFCWYCLASLDDDFLLRHYDKGPCKNKLGHSRASVIWHRTQVIGIFAGFGILLLVASPLLLLAAPCIVCCKCRFCNTGTTKLGNEEDVAPGEES